jgi:hypothetical protein
MTTRALVPLALVSMFATAPARGAEGPELPDLLAKAGAYAVRCERDFSNIFAEESYQQKLFQHRSMRLRQMRTLRSEIVFVKLDGDLRWASFRDVFEVDEKPVRTRDARLETLLLKPTVTVWNRAQEILDESARYNVGSVQRNFNLPTLGLVFLHPDNQPRFRFKKKGHDTVAGAAATVVEYEEKRSPAFVRDGAGHDLFAKGKLWLDPAEGRLLRSEVKIQDAAASYKVEITVEFAPWRDGGIWVPQEMREMCNSVPQAVDRTPGLRERGLSRSSSNATDAGEYLETLATYSKYRAFKVETREDFRPPEVKP